MSDGIKIEKGIPLPVARGCNVKWKTTLGDMNVGDSFVVAELAQVNSIMSICGKVFGSKRFSRRRLSDRTYRIWRIE